jgi:lipoprotein-releasing system permease protein
MRLAPLALIARRHLVHNAFRTTISVGGVAIGDCFMILMAALMTGFKTKFVRETIEASPHVTILDERRDPPDEFERWVSARAGGLVHVESARPRERIYRIKKPLETLEAVRRMPGVAAAAQNVVGTSILNFGSREVGAQLVGIDPGEQDRVVSTDEYMTEGRLTDLHSASGAIVLGSGLAERLGVRRGDTIGAALHAPGSTARSAAGAIASSASAQQSRSLRVVGVFHTGVVTIDSTRAYTLVNLAQQLLGLGRDVNRIVLRLEDYELAREAAADIEAIVGYRTESWQEQNANFLAIFAIQTWITYIVTSGITIVAAFGILNVLIMLVLEKLPEIAMLKSMGYTAVDVTVIFLLEGLAIAAIGVVLGTIGGYWLAQLLGSLPIPMKGLIESEHLVFVDSARVYVVAAFASFASTLLAACLPSLRAGRLDPVVTLRGRA